MFYGLLFVLALAGPASTQESTRFQAPPAELPTYHDQGRVGLNQGYQGQFGLWSDTGTPIPDFHRAHRFGVLTFSAAVVGR